ncbi:MAG: LysM peptidoglycan-binding domain-containing protein [Nevskiaceae bacterium]|jgi:membrane-bound lytic murein transglycosylase D|nr:MAG: LysM peptidoglycan-binding domain-containing protein [Nevskiaceae bacterium]TAM21212.1 MAG: LysM peptidoglycan-binding domain-containing protein [Nevskiaceae bacterium]
MRLSHLLLMLVLALCCGRAFANLDPADDSIWPRIAQGMRLGGEQRPEVQRCIASYTENPAFLSLMLERAAPFLWFIVESAEIRELPMELALLPAVESGFNAHARSASAALGLWQFIAPTGRAYGLGENPGYDARRDPVASTRAAFSYLLELHREFDDWLLALAAYNGGGVRLRAAIEQAGGRRDFWQLPLRNETRDYVPRLLALAAIVREPERYQVRLPTISNRHAAEMVAMDQLPARAFEALGKVDQDLLRRFNPGLKKLNAQARVPTLLLPPSEALLLRAELADEPTTPAVLGQGLSENWLLSSPEVTDSLRLATISVGFPQDSLPKRQQEPSPATPGLHRVRQGETLYSVAQQYGLSVQRLRQYNRLKANAVLEAGRNLKIPSVH